MGIKPSVSYSIYQNFSQYMLKYPKLYRNYLKVWGYPCVYLKLLKERNKDGSRKDGKQFRNIDKYVIAYGKYKAVFTKSILAYDAFNVNFPILNDSYNKINAQFSDSIELDVPIDERFTYSTNDLVTFKFNQYLYKYAVKEEPEQYTNIIYKLSLLFVDKTLLKDDTQIDITLNQNNISRQKYW